ncbi:MAG: hydantoinase/oxoprolinase family protein [Alphaproteobacteria bacterium]|nr:hydantoinase/oxoprolinase family protein [Alphaproteobacteria bacterium]
MATFRAGCDIGGTFTDFVLLDQDTGAIHVGKRLTTPEDPSIAMLAGFAAFAKQAPGYPNETARLAHATTLVANAVIERKGARTALLCTAGFRDVLELRRYVRVTTYELFADPPAPLVPRALRLPVNERTRADGSVLRPVDAADIAELAARLSEESIESVAICFLHAFTNPANEREAARLLALHLPAIPVSLSSDVLPQIKEFERSSTTVVNAYVKPLTRRYLRRVSAGVREAGFAAPLQIMLSNGGIASAETAAEFPVRLIESGPVAGATVARHFGVVLGLPEVLSFDMGGTTAKACLIRDGQLPLTDELEVARSRRFTKSSGFPVATPAVNMIEIGAGGGSIAALGPLGIVQVGPESAGAVPGPVCYGGGGTAPTVTDADLTLGYLDPERFAGGSMRLDSGAAGDAIARTLGKPLGLDAVAAAWTVHDVVNETMAAAVRMHVTERGGDPSRPVLVAFGGAGPVHVANLAAKLGIRRVIVPLRAGVLSALGLLLSPAAFDLKRTRKQPLAQFDPEAARAEIAEMQESIAQRLAEAAPGMPPSFAVTLEIGYIGQGYQVPVPVAPDRLASINAASLLAGFAEIYRAKYGYYYDDVPAELVNILVAGQAGEAPEIIAPLPDMGAVALAPRGHRRAWSARRGALTDFAVYDRDLLRPGMAFAGPALIEESSATTVADCDSEVSVDRFGSLVITAPEEPQ